MHLKRGSAREGRPDGMRRRGDQSRFTHGKYTGHQGAIEANVYQKTVDYSDEWANGCHVMLDSEELVTVRWDQVEDVP